MSGKPDYKVYHTCSGCEQVWSGVERAHCKSCHKTFNSVYAFDKHRTGTYEPCTRRCMTTEEMEAKGMCLNADGYWVTALQDPAAGKGRGIARKSKEQ